MRNQEDHSSKYKDAFGNPLIIQASYAFVKSDNGLNYSFLGTLERVTIRGTAILKVNITGESIYYRNMKIKENVDIVKRIKCNQLIRYDKAYI